MFPAAIRTQGSRCDGVAERAGHLRDALGAWEEMRRRLAAADRICLLTDFDGTLSPLVDTPSAAVLDPDVSIVLRSLARQERAVIAVLSGRSIDDLSTRVSLPVILAGDHGLEIHGRKFHFQVPGAEAVRDEIVPLSDRILCALRRIPGVLVESKRFTVSVHVRHVARHRIPEVRQITLSCINHERWEVREGICVLEIRPRLEWHKGHAAQWILDRCGIPKSAAICLGDDKTDSDMFRELPDAYNIQIGFDPQDLGAQYWLPRGDVAQFLMLLLTLVRS